MRIISGVLGHRVFESPKGRRTHPMSEKIRGALFNMLGDINGLTVLDAFGGSGALSFEAVSRGAKSVVVLEPDKSAFKIIVANINTLELKDQVTAIRKFGASWSAGNRDMLFDIVLLDPPYDDIDRTLLLKMARHAKPGGILVMSLPPGVGFKVPTDLFEELSVKSYGDAELHFYRKK